MMRNHVQMLFLTSVADGVVLSAVSSIKTVVSRNEGDSLQLT